MIGACFDWFLVDDLQLNDDFYDSFYDNKIKLTQTTGKKHTIYLLKSYY